MAKPREPVVEQVDTEHEAAVKRAMSTISQALVTDEVSLYMSTSEQADRFDHAIMRSYLDSGPQLFFQVDNFSCCALVEELKREDSSQQKQPAEQPQQTQQQGQQQSKEAADEAILVHARSGRAEALARLGAQPLLTKLVEEHGAALCVHFLGALPACQGQGLGGTMLRHLCQLADSSLRHMYIEASTTRSQALYARHGFAHIADKPLGGPGEADAPVLRIMVRPPSSAALAGAADGEAAADDLGA